ncbi:MAG: hypothetical protein JO239_01330 [Paraburkholderia sp.]|nr:hypothetical protein [Paraburkholderia sp.]
MMPVTRSVSKLVGAGLDYWVARALHEFVSEISFADDPDTVYIKGNGPRPGPQRAIRAVLLVGGGVAPAGQDQAIAA